MIYLGKFKLSLVPYCLDLISIVLDLRLQRLFNCIFFTYLMVSFFLQCSQDVFVLLFSLHKLILEFADLLLAEFEALTFQSQLFPNLLNLCSCLLLCLLQLSFHFLLELVSVALHVHLLLKELLRLRVPLIFPLANHLLMLTLLEFILLQSFLHQTNLTLPFRQLTCLLLIESLQFLESRLLIFILLGQ